MIKQIVHICEVGVDADGYLWPVKATGGQLPAYSGRSPQELADAIMEAMPHISHVVIDHEGERLNFVEQQRVSTPGQPMAA